MNTKSQTIIIKEREPQPHNCDICGKPVRVPDDMWIGGYLSWAHPECAEMADKAVKRYLRWLTVTHVGITQFARDIMEVDDT